MLQILFVVTVRCQPAVKNCSAWYSSVFSEDKHEPAVNVTHIFPTISLLLDSLQREGFQPFFACQTRVRDPGRREPLQSTCCVCLEVDTIKQVPEIILLNSHDGTSSYQMLPGYSELYVRTVLSVANPLARYGLPQ